MKRIGLALVVLLAMTGCAEVGSLTDKAQIDLALQNLSSDLDALAGITTEYTAELTPDYTYTVGVHATAHQLTEQQLAAAAGLVLDQLGEGVFDRQQVYFDLSVTAGTVLSISDFDLSADDLRAGVELAAAVGEAYGSTGTLSVGEQVGVGVLSASSTPDWNGIRAIVEENPGLYWQFPGLSFEGVVPSIEVTDLVDGIGALVPLGFDTQLYVSLDVYDDGAIVTMAASGVDVDDPGASPVWPQALGVAALIAASPLAAPGFMFYGLDNDGTAIVYFGECAEPVPGGEADATLAAALALPDVHAGQCLRA